MVLKQDSEDIGAIVLEDGVIGEIRYILRSSLCCFVDTGSRWDRNRRSGRSLWNLHNNQVREN